RTTVTGARTPPTRISPSICASDDFASARTSGGLCVVRAVPKTSTAATSCFIRPPTSDLRGEPPSFAAGEYLLHVVHDAVHLLQRQPQRLVRRHVDAGVLGEIDRILRPTGREERQIALRRRRVSRQHLLRQRRGRGERGRVLEDVEVQVEVGNERPLVLDVVVDEADALVVAVVLAGD